MTGVIKNYDNEMDKIEKIRQEIERRKVQYYEREMKAWDDNGEYGDEDCYFYQGKRKACEGLLCFIDTLSEEPDKSLEEAADKHIRKVVDAAGHPGWDWTTQDIAEAFIAGAKRQKEQMLKDAVEGEAEELYNDGESQCVVSVGTYFKPGDEVYVIPKEAGK